MVAALVRPHDSERAVRSTALMQGRIRRSAVSRDALLAARIVSRDRRLPGHVAVSTMDQRSAAAAPARHPCRLNHSRL